MTNTDRRIAPRSTRTAPTHAAREYAYDRTSSIGRLDKALYEAHAKGWIVVDMKNDWKTIFPPQR